MNITIRNRKNAPIVCNVPNLPSLYFQAKEQREITEEQFNAPEVKEQIEAGNLIVIRMGQ